MLAVPPERPSDTNHRLPPLPAPSVLPPPSAGRRQHFLSRMPRARHISWLTATEYGTLLTASAPDAVYVASRTHRQTGRSFVSRHMLMTIMVTANIGGRSATIRRVDTATMLAPV